MRGLAALACPTVIATDLAAMASQIADAIKRTQCCQPSDALR
ncbi:MAG: hypothetical protein ACTS2F_12625 [Thainema sp.]